MPKNNENDRRLPVGVGFFVADQQSLSGLFLSSDGQSEVMLTGANRRKSIYEIGSSLFLASSSLDPVASTVVIERY
jgi:hypothetical protein